MQHIQQIVAHVPSAQIVYDSNSHDKEETMFKKKNKVIYCSTYLYFKAERT